MMATRISTYCWTLSNFQVNMAGFESKVSVGFFQLFVLIGIVS